MISCRTTPEPEPLPEPTQEPAPVQWQSLNLRQDSLVLSVGDSPQLAVDLVPESGELPDDPFELVNFTSDNDEVARVDGAGRVTALRPGTVQIHATLSGDGEQVTDEAQDAGEASLTDSVWVVVRDEIQFSNAEARFILIPDKQQDAEHTFWIMDTPVTHTLWQEVYRWAVQDRGDGRREDGGELYSIPSLGRRGNDGAQSKSGLHPVTRVSWRSAAVWMNALTEYYNAVTGSNRQLVYYVDSDEELPLRRATREERIRRDVFISQDNPHVVADADGFRLPRDHEWQSAATFPEGISSMREHAVYRDTSGGSTAEVASRAASLLGIYDLYGNVSEWVFDWHPGYVGDQRALRGGSWNSPGSELRPDSRDFARPYHEDGTHGLRPVRTERLIHPERINVTSESLDLTVGQSQQIEAEVLPRNASDRSLIWSSSNPEVASVTPDGVVRARAAGTTSIRIDAAGPHDVSRRVDVTVRIAVQGLSLQEYSAVLEPGQQLQLAAEIYPREATDTEVDWKSAHPDIVSVDSEGTVTAHSVGTTTITAVTRDGGLDTEFTAVVKLPVFLESGDEPDSTDADFSLVQVPAVQFPAGIDDDLTAEVDYEFWLADTEVTYALWARVRDWARESAGYTIPAAGRRGGYWPDRVATGPDHPVTEVDWVSAMAWMNALTEMYNQVNDADLVPVYYADPDFQQPLGRAANTADAARGGIHVRSRADGFRLPFAEEWELAARYKGADSSGGAMEFPENSGGFWTPGNYASGAVGSVDDHRATREVAVVPGVPGSTEAVRSRSPNPLWLWDMSGNISEWVLLADADGGSSYAPAHRGGSYFDNPSALRVSRVEAEQDENGLFGFTAGLRIARGAADTSPATRVVPDSEQEEPAPEPQPEAADPEQESEPESAQPAQEPQASMPESEPDPASESETVSGPAQPETDDGTIGTLVENYSDIDLELVSAGGFAIGTTEITYGQWRTVYNWAAENGYQIPDEGARHFSAESDDYPVTRVSWRSALVWTNALTEYLNEQYSSSLQPVYYVDADFRTPLRQASNTSRVDTTPGSVDAPHVHPDADGFRLPTAQEWLAAATWGGEQEDWISGADALLDDPQTAAELAVFGTAAPEPAGSRRPNSLGLYDMSGNVDEWVFDWHPAAVNRRRMRRGGSFRNTLTELSLGRAGSAGPGESYHSATGLRVVRSLH
ncbi:SUMF1/EgtB/PvdO family nonheme iron enzyme [Spirochaeta africana]|nr:SUMF1/EgtB/PvdO family nonheme iron enzyme [Spirochaeta africana]